MLGWHRELRCDEEDEEDEFRGFFFGCTGDSAALAAAVIVCCFFTWSMTLFLLLLLGRPACAFFIDAMTIFVGFMSSSIAAVPLTGKLEVQEVILSRASLGRQFLSSSHFVGLDQVTAHKF